MLFFGLWCGLSLLAFVCWIGLGSLFDNAAYLLGGVVAIGAILAAVFSSYYKQKEKLEYLTKKVEHLTELMEKQLDAPPASTIDKTSQLPED